MRGAGRKELEVEYVFEQDPNTIETMWNNNCMPCSCAKACIKCTDSEYPSYMISAINGNAELIIMHRSNMSGGIDVW